jgi:hypothetical protein
MNRLLTFPFATILCLCVSTAQSQGPIGFNVGIGVDAPAGNLSSNQSHGSIFTLTGQFSYTLQDNVSYVADISYHAMGYNSEDTFGVFNISAGPRIGQFVAGGTTVYIAVPMMGIVSAGGSISPAIGFGMGLLFPSPNNSPNHNVDLGIRFTHAGPFSSGYVHEVNILNIQLALGIF